MREIYIAGDQQREIAVVEDGHLVEYLLDDASEASSAESIYLGRVERVLNGMKAAFVDIGQKLNGFLPLEERNLHGASALQAGMRILVQVRREAAGSKGAFLSRDIALCGEYVLLTPMNASIGVSARIPEGQTRSALKALAAEIAGGEFGLVMRSAAQTASEVAIREETAALLTQWKDIRSRAPVAPAPSLIHGARSQLDCVIDDYRPWGIDRIHTEDASLAPLLETIAPVTVSQPGVMARMGWIHQRTQALERRVWLKSGGNLMIDPCEAMTVIDVNTAKFTGKRQLEETILRLNLEACAEAARQIRLRNLSGIIIIDMIDMQAEESRRQVLQALREALSHDRVKTVVHGFTALGLVEMTRKRSRLPLRDVWSEPCRSCRGTGRHTLKEDNHG